MRGRVGGGQIYSFIYLLPLAYICYYGLLFIPVVPPPYHTAPRRRPRTLRPSCSTGVAPLAPPEVLETKASEQKPQHRWQEDGISDSAHEPGCKKRAEKQKNAKAVSPLCNSKQIYSLARSQQPGYFQSSASPIPARTQSTRSPTGGGVILLCKRCYL